MSQSWEKLLTNGRTNDNDRPNEQTNERKNDQTNTGEIIVPIQWKP